MVVLCLVIGTFGGMGAGAVPFESPRYGLSLTLPEGWTILEREHEDRVFVASVGGLPEGERGLLACELALAPESLREWRDRIQKQGETGRLKGLVRNEVSQSPKGERLDTLLEIPLDPDTLAIEHTVRLVAHRQLYAFRLRATSDAYARVRADFESLLKSIAFTAPKTGTRRADEASNRWEQTEFKFALNLPQGWQPVLAPSEVALLYANGPAHGIWSDNCLVIARRRGETSLQELEKELPDRIRREDPNCEIVHCKLVKCGEREALETQVRTQRGPFSMTVLEHRFPGERFDYEVKFTVETERFDADLPTFRKCLESFQELDGAVPGLGKSA